MMIQQLYSKNLMKIFNKKNCRIEREKKNCYWFFVRSEMHENFCKRISTKIEKRRSSELNALIKLNALMHSNSYTLESDYWFCMCQIVDDLYRYFN